MTSALAGVGGQRHNLATSSSGIRPSFCCTGWWLSLRVFLGGFKKFLTPAALEPQIIKPVVSHYADRAILAHCIHEWN